MSGRLVISAARTRARLVGARSQAPGVERRLQALLAGPVAMRLAAMADRLPEDAVISLPRLEVRLSLTLAELEGAAADLWAAQIEAAVEQALARPGVQGQRFASRRAFHAAYLRHRLGVAVAAPGVFADFATLDLLTPARALAEMLSADPALWAELGSAELGVTAGLALQVLQAVLSQGEEALRMILATCVPRPLTVGAQGSAPDLRAVVTALVAASALWPAAMAQPWGSLSLPAQVFLAALTLGPAVGRDPVPPAEVLIALMQLIRPDAPQSVAALHSALSRLAVDQPFLTRIATALREASADPTTATAILTLLPAVARLRPADRPQTSPATRALRPPDAAAKPRPDADAGLHFTAPFAGVALILPHLAEDGIARTFDAATLAEALARLVQSDLFPEPQGHRFLTALSGQAQVKAPPDRPNPRDLLFVPKARHAEIMAAAPGAPRLAAWAMARFAATLPGLGGSSLGFLQRQFFHTAGEVWIDRTRLTLRLDPVPLIAVLELAGRLGPDLARADWLDRQSLTFRCGAP